MKQFIFFAFLLLGLAGMGLGVSHAGEIDSLCLSDGDKIRDSQDDYECILQLREVLQLNGLLPISRTIQRIQDIKSYIYDYEPTNIYIPPTPNYPYIPPTPNYPIFYIPPTPN